MSISISLNITDIAWTLHEISCWNVSILIVFNDVQVLIETNS